MRKILIVIDMQKDFIDGALGTPEAVLIVPNVVSKMEEYAKCDIYATRDTHSPEYMVTQEGRLLPVPHCIKDTDGWELHPEIMELLDPLHIYDKPTFACTDLASDIKKLSEHEDISIELVGLCTDICVISNALLLKAYMPEVPIFVDASCCAGVSQESHGAALRTMEACQIITS